MRRLFSILVIALFIGGMSASGFAAGKGNGRDMGGGRGGDAGSSQSDNGRAGGPSGHSNGLGRDNFGQDNRGGAWAGKTGRAVGGVGMSDGDPSNGNAHQEGARHERNLVQDYLMRNFGIGSRR